MRFTLVASLGIASVAIAIPVVVAVTTRSDYDIGSSGTAIVAGVTAVGPSDGSCTSCYAGKVSGARAS